MQAAREVLPVVLELARALELALRRGELPLIRNTISVPANGTAFPLAGSSYEYLPFHASVEIALNQQSGTVGQVLATVNSGSDILLEEGAISFNARMPIYPDDYDLQDMAAAGERLKIQLRNTTGGAIVVAFGVKLTPIG